MTFCKWLQADLHTTYMLHMEGFLDISGLRVSSDVNGKYCSVVVWMLDSCHDNLEIRLQTLFLPDPVLMGFLCPLK